MVINQKIIKLSEIKSHIELMCIDKHNDLFKYGYRIFLNDFFELTQDLFQPLSIQNNISQLDLELLFESTLDHINFHFKDHSIKNSILIWEGISLAQENTF